MIDLTAPLLFVAAEATKGVLGEGSKALWSSIVAAYRKLRGADFEASGIDAATSKALLESSPELSNAVRAYATESSVLRRARTMTEAIRGTRLLWVDDRPEWNILERRSFESLGMVVTSVQSTRSALACLKRETFDLLISDIDRGGRQTEGVDVLPELKPVTSAPIIFYVGEVTERVPRGAFGITADPVELLHLCLDAISRSRL